MRHEELRTMAWANVQHESTAREMPDTVSGRKTL